MARHKLMPAVQEMMTGPLQQAGFGADQLMAVMMQIKSYEDKDASIKADVEKLMKAVQGDLSGF